MDAMLQKTLGVGANGAAVIKADGSLAFRQDWADVYAIERALAEAQRQVRRTKGLAHPYYWAGYVVVGDAQARDAVQLSSQP